jgi:hypothetical protein
MFRIHPESHLSIGWAAPELHGLDDETLRTVTGGNMMDLLGISTAVAT